MTLKLKTRILMKNEEEYLYQSIRKGDKKAFENFYKSYHPKLFAYGMSILKDEENVRDLVQESFITFWENRTHIIADYSVTAYLFKIFQNKCLKQIRFNAVRTNFSNLSELKLQEIELSYYDPDENILGSIFMHDVETLYAKAIQKLPEQCREIFVLSRQHQMKSNEIALKLGISVRTVENHIYKAMRIIREEMKDYALPVFLILVLLKELF